MDNLIGTSIDKDIPGVSGENADGSGVRGISKSGTGVLGTSESGVAVWGGSQSSSGVGGMSASGYGVHGVSTSNQGVHGDSEKGTGVWGRSTAPANSGQAGVIGEAFDAVGVFGKSQSSTGVGGMSATGIGVHGISQTGTGVQGNSPSGRGVAGFSDSWQGVYGFSKTNAGVVGESEEFDGVFGVSLKATAAGVSGHNKAGGLAGFFEGDVYVSQKLTVKIDIVLENADCAEDFNIGTSVCVEPGTVMVLGEEGALFPSQHAYDKRVAGVVSGAGDYKPGIVLDKQASESNRQPIALLGKVFCKVDAQFGAIEVGDLLTTSPTQGHAMKADDHFKAFGAVIGKALRPFTEGQGLIPVLIALQ